MKHFNYKKIEGKYSLFVKLLSYRTPFEFMSELERGVAKRVRNGLILIDEAEHNDNPEKRYLQVVIRNGELLEETFDFVLDYDSEEEDVTN